MDRHGMTIHIYILRTRLMLCASWRQHNEEAGTPQERGRCEANVERGNRDADWLRMAALVAALKSGNIKRHSKRPAVRP